MPLVEVSVEFVCFEKRAGFALRFGYCFNNDDFSISESFFLITCLTDFLQCFVFGLHSSLNCSRKLTKGRFSLNIAI